MDSIAQQLRAFKARKMAEAVPANVNGKAAELFEGLEVPARKPRLRLSNNVEVNASGQASLPWPSKVLHQMPMQMGADGICPVRLNALADFIDTLHGWNSNNTLWKHRKVVVMKAPHGLNPVTHYVVNGKAGAAGLGFIPYDCQIGRDARGGPMAWAMTGYGIICWGWGSTVGMSAVARDHRVNEVQRVITAAPVLDPVETNRIRWMGQVRPQNVADAIRAYIEHLDPVEAWRDALMDADETAKRQPTALLPTSLKPPVKVEVKPAPKVVEVQVPEPVAAAAVEVDVQLPPAPVVDEPPPAPVVEAKPATDAVALAEKAMESARQALLQAYLAQGMSVADAVKKLGL